MNDENMPTGEEIAPKVMGDIAGAIGVLMAYIGDQSGVYKAMEQAGPSSLEQLASITQINPRYLQEWLAGNTAQGYCQYDPSTDEYFLTAEQAALFAHEGEPTCLQGFFQCIVSQYETHKIASEVFQSGRGRPWGEHSNCCFCGTDRFFRPGYAANLISTWIPAVEGMEQKLRAGGKVADVGCGHGSSTILMAKEFPDSIIVGYDFHEPSIEIARQKAHDAGLKNIEFHVADAASFSGQQFDMVCIFDALHDMGDPVGVAKHIRDSLKDDGSFMLVEPLAGDNLVENSNPLGAIFYGFSTLICVPTAVAQNASYALGAQAGEKRLSQVLRDGGFRQVQRVSETASNMVLEAKGIA